VATSYQYDSLSRLLSILHTKSSATLDGATYVYDAAGNRTSKTDRRTNVTSTFSYDPLYELTQVLQGTTTTESYSYDAVGNRLSSLGVSPYSYNTSNELNAKPGMAYTYDNNGNTLTKGDSTGTTTYSWDFENRLTSVALPGSGGTVTFKYDPFGRRIQKSSSSGTTNYVYDGANVLEEVDNSGNTVARYVQGLGVDTPLAETRSGTTSYYEADSLESVTSLSNSSGALANTYTYDSYGNLTASTGMIANPYRSTGRDFDSETGVYYYRARYYDPAIGRFISEDPLREDGGSPNFYGYVGNSPTNFTDPLGLAKCIYSVQAHTMICEPNADPGMPSIGGPNGAGAVQLGPNGVDSGGSMQGSTGCTNNNKCTDKRFEGPIAPGNYRMNFDTRPIHQGMDVYRLQPWPHHWYDGLLYDLHISRGGFELHLGTISIGCINTNRRNPAAAQQYQQLDQLLQSENGSNYLTVIP